MLNIVDWSMKYLVALCCLGVVQATARQTIPMDTSNWDIDAVSYVIENYEDYDAVYLQSGYATLKNQTFEDGIIEFDVYMTERAGFPGVMFRQFDEQNGESFYLRPHQSGNPDANQGAPIINGITAWQLYFGASYSVPYQYRFHDWTHVKLVVQGQQAQVYLDHSEEPNLSWKLVHASKPGKISFGGGGAAVHYANFQVYPGEGTIKNFMPAEPKGLEGVVKEWTISDKFEEKELDDIENLDALIQSRTWTSTLGIDEKTAANISRIHQRYGNVPGNTAFARLEIETSRSITRLFEFGYSDRVVVILNGSPIYRGNNRWRSRDYRYLGTIGLFDAVYLPLKKGKNTLLLAVSEDFGGWLITGRFLQDEGLRINP